MLGNRLDDALRRLDRTLALQPSDADAKVLKTETLYRKNRFFKASEALAGLGPKAADKLRTYSTLNAAKLATFKGQTPYEFHSSGESTRIRS